MVVTKTNLTRKVGLHDAMACATDLASGQPVAGLEAMFYDENNQQLGSATTDNDGLAQLDLGKRPNRYSVLAVVLPDGEAQAFSAVSENWAQGVSPYDFVLEYTYTLPD